MSTFNLVYGKHEVWVVSKNNVTISLNLKYTVEEVWVYWKRKNFLPSKKLILSFVLEGVEVELDRTDVAFSQQMVLSTCTSLTYLNTTLTHLT